ncbi:MAG: NepR family anti-sigma factor [Allorhizobium sp.]
MTRFPEKASIGRGKANAHAHSAITAQLRQFYQSVQEEGIPDKFLALLEKLDAAEKSAGNRHAMKDPAR